MGNVKRLRQNTLQLSLIQIVCQQTRFLRGYRVVMTHRILYVTPFVSKLIIFYSQNTDSQTPFIIISCLAKQNNTKVGIGGYVIDAVSTFKQLLVL